MYILYMYTKYNILNEATDTLLLKPAVEKCLSPPSGSESQCTNTIDMLKAPRLRHVPICYSLFRHYGCFSSGKPDFIG